jgi:hypothetical protein
MRQQGASVLRSADAGRSFPGMPGLRHASVGRGPRALPWCVSLGTGVGDCEHPGEICGGDGATSPRAFPSVAGDAWDTAVPDLVTARRRGCAGCAARSPWPSRPAGAGLDRRVPAALSPPARHGKPFATFVLRGGERYRSGGKPASGAWHRGGGRQAAGAASRPDGDKADKRAGHAILQPGSACPVEDQARGIFGLSSQFSDLSGASEARP